MKKFLALALAAVMLLGLTPVLASEAESDTTYDHYFYDQLEPEQQAVYDVLEAMEVDGSLAAGENRVVSDSSLQSQVLAYVYGDGALLQTFGAARDAFEADHPEVFWVNFDKLSFVIYQTGTSYTLTVGSGREADYYNTGFTSALDVESARAELAQISDAVLSELDGMSDQEKVCYIHNYITANCSYHLELDCSDGNVDSIRTAYGPLVAGEALCEGYAKAFKLLADEAGIPCVYVNGFVDDNGQPQPHAWNEVCIDGEWYAVDVTLDDPRSSNTEDGLENTVYLLVGSGMMDRTHQTDGVMSDANYEFTYPVLSETSPKFEGLTENNGLTVAYSGSEMVNGYETATFHVSFDGMGYAKAAQSGYWMLSKSYLYGYEEDDLTEMDWAYLTPELYSGMEDTDTYVSYSAPQIAYVEFAVTTTPIGDTSDPKNLYFTGDPATIIAETGLLYNEAASYVAPPYPVQVVPAATKVLDVEKTYNMVFTYDEPLRLTSDPLAVIVTKLDPTSTDDRPAGYAVENVAFDEGSNSISFSFTPSQYYADDSIGYQFSFTGIEGTTSGKAPKSVTYGVRFCARTTCSTYGRLHGWNVFAKPAILDIPDVSGWTLADGTAIPASLTDRMALVVSEVSPSQEQAMQDLVENTVLASECFNIDFTLCKEQVVTNGDAVSVKIGFPSGYDAGSDVTYKVYHFLYDESGNVTGVEEVPCAVTEYGLVAYCSSFSPYMVAATEKDETAAEIKTIVLNSSYGGVVTATATALSEGESATITVTPDEGYQVDTISALGQTVTETEFVVNYEDIGSNVLIDVTFVAETVAESLPEDTALVSQPTEVTEVPDDETDPTPDPTSTYYTVTYHYNGEVASVAVKEGETAPEKEVSKSGYNFRGWYLDEDYDVAYDFGPVTGNIDLYAWFVRRNSNLYRVRVTWDADGGDVTWTHGGITATKADINVTKGQKLIFHITPNELYRIDSVTVNGESVTVKNNTVTIASADKDYTVKVTFTPVSVSDLFDDVSEKSWYAQDVLEMVREGLMMGTGDNLWSPTKTLTRAEVAAILERMDGGTGNTKYLTFEDVDVHSWYADPVAYCLQSGYMVGESRTMFRPEREITREEFMVTLYRMAGEPRTGNTKYDLSEVSDWAVDAVKWGVEEGLLEGDGNQNLNPKAYITRAEAAAVLTRLNDLTTD